MTLREILKHLVLDNESSLPTSSHEPNSHGIITLASKLQVPESSLTKQRPSNSLESSPRICNRQLPSFSRRKINSHVHNELHIIGDWFVYSLRRTRERPTMGGVKQESLSL
ncbi:hypothetical protein BDZ45DRAFT_753039 [Acephala macrosclerotiorum]|nr:hypothetical protein BDZ45DRAFT_753039 [Acephala macrosclerotiorum]